VQIKFIYTLMRSEQDPSVVLFGVDAEESLKDKSHVGDVYREGTARGMAGRLDRVQAEPQLLSDQWGTWVTATAPVKDAQGRTVAAVAVDMAAGDLNAEVRSTTLSGVAELGTAVALAAAVALLLARWVSRPLRVLKEALEKVGKGELDAKVALAGRDEFAEVGRSIEAMCKGLRERQALKEAVVRYHSRHVAEQIVSTGQLPALHGERRKVTVLFSDIRGFTTMSHAMAPEQVVALLNEYFERMIDILFKHQGTLDKFIGDGLMAVFGAPLEDLFQEEHAVAAAVEMQQALRELSDNWRERGLGELKVGIGINTGMAVVGNIGSSQRMEYTAVGDTVNLASRLEAQAKTLDASVLISEYTYLEVRNRFAARPMGTVELRGRSTPVAIYAVEGVRERPTAAAA
jgi:adenylate cyclase